MEIKSKFKFFRRNNLNYLDNSATTQVPDSVFEGVEQILSYRGNPSRSSHVVSEKCDKLIKESRDNIARFIGAYKNEIVFTNNATDSLNLAVDSISEQIKEGDEIMIGISEHHSNLIPYLKLIKKGAKIRTIELEEGLLSIKDIQSKLNNKTKIVAIAHSSNVLGNINKVIQIGSLIKNYNEDIFFIVDGSQAVAHIPVNVKDIRADFYAFSGHKMYGPDGIGVLYISENIHHLISPIRAGGGTVKNVTVVRENDFDTILPEYFSTLSILEGGTQNSSNIVGLSRAVNFIRSIGFDYIQEREQNLTYKLIQELRKIEEIIIWGPEDLNNKVGLVSFSLKNFSVKELGDYLGKQKICIRYGSHCAFPLAERMGQESLRISLGVYNSEEDIDQVVNEIKFFINKKKGLIKNKNLEILKSKIYYKNLSIVNSSVSIINKIKQGLYNEQDTEIIVMGGHFLGIPDVDENKFWPSIQGLLPEKLDKLMEEFGMTSFSLFTWELACKIVSSLQKEGYKAKLSVIANDTTGINEIRLSKININNKTAEIYRDELLAAFSKNDIPLKYFEILKKYKLAKKDIIKNGSEYYFRETNLRSNFKKFISNNKKYFSGVIDYTAENNENIDLSINILDNQQIKTCSFDTFNSKTGGKFCIIELCQFMAEMFGKAQDVDFPYISEKVKRPKVKESKHKVLVTLTPAMCNNAVERSAELYSKLFLQEKGEGSFKFFNIPFGPKSERSLAIGAEMIYISDKDNLEVLDVEEEPLFPDLWRLTEDKLLYDPNEYFKDIEKLFEKINITKESKILDTCVGPGFFATDLLKEGYDLSTSDKNPNMIVPFQRTLKEIGIEHKTIISEWLELPKHFQKESFDFLFNRGNSFIYAAGGWNKMVEVNKEETINTMRETLKIYYDLLKPGGYLYIDKFKDSEIPNKKMVARINIKNTGEKKDIIFYVERRPQESVRFAQMILRDKDEKEQGLPNIAYDLSTDEMELLLKEAGFDVDKVQIESEKHFVVWLARKNHISN